VARPRFGGNAGVGDAERAAFENLRAQVGREWTWCTRVYFDECRRVGVGKRLERFVCAQPVACTLGSMAEVVMVLQTLTNIEH